MDPLCFLPVCLCDAKCHWEWPNMSAAVRLNCLSLGFKSRVWMKAVLLSRFVSHAHVPLFSYNGFLMYVQALDIANFSELFFVIERNWDNWSIERNKVHCHSRELGVCRRYKADTEPIALSQCFMLLWKNGTTCALSVKLHSGFSQFIWQFVIVILNIVPVS